MRQLRSFRKMVEHEMKSFNELFIDLNFSAHISSFSVKRNVLLIEKMHLVYGNDLAAFVKVGGISPACRLARQCNPG
jgi:hypothetical protein